MHACILGTRDEALEKQMYDSIFYNFLVFFCFEIFLLCYSMEPLHLISPKPNEWLPCPASEENMLEWECPNPDGLRSTSLSHVRGGKHF